MLCGVMQFDLWASNPFLTFVQSGWAPRPLLSTAPLPLLPWVLTTPSCKSRIHDRKKEKGISLPSTTPTGSSPCPTAFPAHTHTPPFPVSRRGHCCSLYSSALLQSMCLMIYTPQG